MTDPVKSESIPTPHVKDKSLRPSGSLPKNVQRWVVLGIAVVIIVVIALSGNKSPVAPSTQAPTNVPSVTDTDEARIQEYRNRIDEDARRLVAEQERLRGTKQAVAQAASQAVSQAASKTSGEQNRYSEIPTGRVEVDERQVKSPVELEMEKREYQSLFASNIALSYRKEEIAGSDAAPLEGGSSQPMAILQESPYGIYPAAMPVLSALQPQVQTAGQQPSIVASGVPSGQTIPSEPVTDDSNGNKTKSPNVNGFGQPVDGKYRIFEGSVLESVLTNRLTGSFSGPVNCMVTTDVYSRDGRYVLIPRGSRVLGEASKVEAFGQERLAVAFHRLIMPDGYSARLDQLPGLDQAGATGLRDKVNNHYLRIFGMSVAIGALSGLTQYNTQYGSDVSSSDIYRQGVSRSLGDSSVRILDQLTNILPTFTIREGHRIKIYLTADLDLPPYGLNSRAEKGVLR